MENQEEPLPGQEALGAEAPLEATPPPTKKCLHASEPCRMCPEVSRARIVNSDELLQGQSEMYIVHGKQIYRLLRPRNDKLILQK